MNVYWGLGLVLANSIIGIFGKRKLALLIYITLAIIAPITNIFGAKVSYEILGFFPLLFFYLISKKSRKVSKISIYLISYFSIFILSTLVSNLIHSPRNEFLAIFGVARMILLFLIFIDDTKNLNIIKKALQIALFTNILAMIMQFILPNAVEIFNKLYVKESSTAISWFLQVGRFTRLTGTFTNTAPAGYFFLVVLAIHLVEYTKTRSKFNAVIIIVSLIGGLATVSKTFYIGCPILLLANFILYTSMKSKEKNSVKGLDFKKPAIIIITVLGIILFNNFTSNKLSTSYYIENLGLSKIFVSRYSAQSGVLMETIDVIKDNLLIGVGATKISNEFVGDSLYVSILHGTGLLGLIIIGFLMIKLTLTNIKKANRQNLLLLVCILMIGFATTTLFNILGMLVLAFVELNQNNTSHSY